MFHLSSVEICRFLLVLYRQNVERLCKFLVSVATILFGCIFSSIALEGDRCDTVRFAQVAFEINDIWYFDTCGLAGMFTDSERSVIEEKNIKDRWTDIYQRNRGIPATSW